MRPFLSSELSQKANKWQSRNNSRWHSAEYDAAFAASEAELDPVKRAALFIRMNDLVVGGGCVVPLVNRARVRGAATKLVPSLSVLGPRLRVPARLVPGSLSATDATPWAPISFAAC